MMETPVVFRSGNDDLFGIVRSPTSGASARGVVILPGGRYGVSAGRNRVAVRLSERLATAGYHVLRFDYHGIGDSSGTVGELRLDRPFVEDLDAAAECLGSFGVERLVLVGDCFGARLALASIDRVPGVHALVLVSLPLRDYARGEGSAVRMAERESIVQYTRKGLRADVWRSLRNPARRHTYRVLIRTKTRQMMRSVASGGTPDPWLSGRVIDQFGRVSRAGIPALVLYGTDEDDFADFERARRGALGPALARSPRIEVETVPGHVHAFRSVAVQEQFLDITTKWVRRNDAEHLGAS